MPGNAIVNSLLRKYVKVPTGDALKDVIRNFESKWGFPQCVGAICPDTSPAAAEQLDQAAAVQPTIT